MSFGSGGDLKRHANKVHFACDEQGHTDRIHPSHDSGETWPRNTQSETVPGLFVDSMQVSRINHDHGGYIPFEPDYPGLVNQHRLQDDEHNYIPSPQYPWGPPENNDAVEPDSITKNYVCLVPNCMAKSFVRFPDLDRHQKQVHGGGYDQEKFTASPQYSWGPLNNISSAESDFVPKKYVCLASSCSSKPFNRSADLERHIRQVHGRENETQKFYCDYSKCERKDGAFGREDHFKDHIRDYHKEDILQRGRSVTKNWLSERCISSRWFRCSKCLRRVTIADHGWECPSCKFLCEAERKRLRIERSGK